MNDIQLICAECGKAYEYWFDTCPDCNDARRRKHPKNMSEVSMNLAEERQCPVCKRRYALKITKLVGHLSKRVCSRCGYQDRIDYWLEDLRSW